MILGLVAAAVLATLITRRTFPDRPVAEVDDGDPIAWLDVIAVIVVVWVWFQYQ